MRGKIIAEWTQADLKTPEGAMKAPFGYLPEQIRRIFGRLFEDVCSLNQKWSLYSKLFLDPEAAVLLDGVARRAFNVIRESLINDMVMLLGRLCDPAIDGHGNKNVSFEALLVKAPQLGGLKQKIDDFDALWRPIIRKHRDKLIAHNDLRARISPRAKPIPGIPRSQVDKMVEAANEILNYVVQQYESTEIAFDLLRETCGADRLIFWLKKAKAPPR